LKLFVGITDFDWFTYLSDIPEIDEVNFWQPSGHQRFQTLNSGEPFLFKLHSPHDYIVGGGFFAHSTILPTSLAWDTFLEKNGAISLLEMRRRIEKYRRSIPLSEDYQIGCILLEQPFFFKKEEWIPVPSNWSSNIVRGKTYDTTIGLGKKLWEDVQIRLKAKHYIMTEAEKSAEETSRYGEPIMVIPRLGQGSFRIIVTDAYNRRCAVTQERTLPALEAAHIKFFKDSGPHRVENGILLRSDIHKLFDTGYVTITPDYHFEVSRRIKEEFENGRDYYAMHGRTLYIPKDQKIRPAHEFIEWHNENIYRG
jgi:putative restriction endonuclease